MRTATRRSSCGTHGSHGLAEAVPITVRFAASYKLPLQKRIEAVNTNTPRPVLIAILKDCLKAMKEENV